MLYQRGLNWGSHASTIPVSFTLSIIAAHRPEPFPGKSPTRRSPSPRTRLLFTHSPSSPNRPSFPTFSLRYLPAVTFARLSFCQSKHASALPTTLTLSAAYLADLVFCAHPPASLSRSTLCASSLLSSVLVAPKIRSARRRRICYLNRWASVPVPPHHQNLRKTSRTLAPAPRHHLYTPLRHPLLRRGPRSGIATICLVPASSETIRTFEMLRPKRAHESTLPPLPIHHHTLFHLTLTTLTHLLRHQPLLQHLEIGYHHNQALVFLKRSGKQHISEHPWLSSKQSTRWRKRTKKDQRTK